MTHIEAKSINIWLSYDLNCLIKHSFCNINECYTWTLIVRQKISHFIMHPDIMSPQGSHSARTIRAQAQLKLNLAQSVKIHWDNSNEGCSTSSYHLMIHMNHKHMKIAHYISLLTNHFKCPICVNTFGSSTRGMLPISLSLCEPQTHEDSIP